MSKRGSPKRGQISIMIIIGIIILLSAIIIIYLTDISYQDPKLVEEVYEVPLRARPVSSYVDNCLSEIATEALVKLGEQGGYIYPDKWGYSARGSAYDTNALKFAPNSDMVIPYWYYLHGNECPDGVCQYEYGIPPLYRETGGEWDRSIEEQVDRYVEDNIGTCVQDFETFERSGLEIVEQGEPEAKTSVQENDVGVRFYWPLELRDMTGDATISIKEFSTTVPVNLKNIYENGLKILADEIYNAYVEHLVNNLIVTFSGIERDQLPPPSALDFDPGTDIFWRKSVVEERVKGMVASYVPGLQYANSRNYEYRSSSDEFEEYFYNNAMVIYSIEGADQLDVTFDYLPAFWDMYFDLNCDGEICRPRGLSVFEVINIGYYQYEFYYDLSFPFLVTMHDPDALHDGYTFQFAIEANIRDNKALRGNYTGLYSIVGEGVGENMFCDVDKRNAGPYLFNITNGYTGDGISDVSVVYRCGDHNCIIDMSDEDGLLEADLPVCFGGRVSFMKDGYLSKTVPLSTSMGESRNVSVMMYPFKDLKVNLRKKRMVSVPPVKEKHWEFKNNPLKLLDSEEAIIVLTREGEDGEGSHEAVVLFQENKTNQTIELAPGEYSIEIRQFNEEPYVIPEYEECFETGWPGDEECYTVNRTVMNGSVPVGGCIMDYEFSAAQMMNASEVTFYTVTPDIYAIRPESSRRVEILEVLSMVENHTQQLRGALVPKLT